MEGYIALALLATVVACCVFPTIQLIVGGVHHPQYRLRQTRAWIILAFLSPMLWWPFALQPIALFLAIILLVLGWPIYRGLGSAGPLVRLSVAAAFLALLCVVSVSARVWWEQEFAMPPGDCGFLEQLRPDQAERAADAAIARGDFHLLGVYGFSLDLPGVDKPVDPRLHPTQPIDCTGDDPVSRKQARLNDRAIRYAKEYNRRILGLAAPESDAEKAREQ